jgi:multidrug resistance protein, MATE family
MIRGELRPMLALAAPVVMAELGWVTMGIVDTIMVGSLGASAIGAVGLASMLFVAVAVFAMGLLLGLDPLVAQAFGARRLDECHRWLIDGLWLSASVAPPMIAVVFVMNATMGRWGLPRDVLVLAQPYLAILTWSLAPLLAYVAFRRYLQAMNLVRPIMFALVAANLVNAAANWVLIGGHLGAPAMGVRGSAYATLAARIFMAAWLLLVIVRHEARVTPPALSGVEGRLRDTPFAFDGPRVRQLFVLGFPAAGQTVLEVGVFTAATALAGRVSSDALAAHQIALNLAALTFMVPLGIASAAAVRVGQAIGRDDPRAAIAAGWTAIGLGVGFMAVAAATFLLMPRFLIRLFTPDPAVLEVGVSLLYVAAAFQLFDGLQGVTTGALRGLGDTRTAMMWNLAGHWFVGLPLAYALCFRFRLGVVGLWWGLSSGLIICGVALLLVWCRKGTRLAAVPAGDTPQWLT